MDAAADEDQRARGRSEFVGRAQHLSRVRAAAACLRFQAAGIGPEVGRIEFDFGVRNVFRHIDQNRSRPARGRDREGAPD
jgi:hypothetical protein